MSGIEIGELARAEYGTAVTLLTTAMADNPVNVAVFGANAEKRQRGLARLFGTMLRVLSTLEPLGVHEDGRLIAVAGVAPPGTCQATGRQRIRFTPSMVLLGPATAGRVTSWLSAWGEHDLDTPHVHLGPVAVDPQRQGHGVGSRLLAEHCRRLDAREQVGYLETDKPENVKFYERHGYAVVEQAKVVGVPNWFMSRDPHPDVIA